MQGRTKSRYMSQSFHQKDPFRASCRSVSNMQWLGPDVRLVAQPSLKRRQTDRLAPQTPITRLPEPPQTTKSQVISSPVA
jgi:hypothetical protein